MMADPVLRPDSAIIEQHLSHITRRWGELNLPCVLEVVFLTAQDKAEVRHVARFQPTTEGIAEAAAHVAEMNQHKLNAYAVVNPVDGMKQLTPGRRASTIDIVASFYHFADADDAEAAENIRNFVGPKCTFFVLTGTVPSPRPHVYWELEQPEFDLVAWSSRQSDIAGTLKTDSVIDAPRIMRLGGTINWPKPKKVQKGYVPEMTQLKIYTPEERPPVSAERMARAFSGGKANAQPSLSQQALSNVRQPAGLHIDVGGNFSGKPSLDRELAISKALSGEEWHKEVVRLTGSYVAKGLSDSEIHALTDNLTLSGYTLEETRKEVQQAIDGARRKGWTPAPAYADPAALTIATAPAPQMSAAQEFNAPKRPSDLEWFDDVNVSLAAPYIIKGVVDQGAMSVVYGPSNSGKTFFALDMAFHIAIGAAWRGRRVRQCAVLYLAAEGGRGVSNRIAALRQTNGVCDVPFALKRAGLDLLHQQADLQHICDLAAEVMQQREGLPLLIVIDTLSRVMAGGDENSAADMTALIRNIDAIREATKAHICLVHHTGKDTARGARGHSSLRAATDTEIEVQADGESRAAYVSKQRDNAGGETFPFSLKAVSLGFDQDGDEVVSCVVEVADGEEYAVKKAEKGIGGVQKIVMDAIDAMIGEGMWRPNPGGAGMPDAGRFKSVERDELRRICMGKIQSANPRNSFNAAFKALTEERGLICCGENLVWRKDRKVTQ